MAITARQFERSFENFLDDILDTPSASEIVSDRLQVYVNSLIERHKLVNYAIEQLDELLKDLYGVPGSKLEARITFYANAFWTFCYSQFDVLAQVANVLFHVTPNEAKVGFFDIANNTDVPKIVADKMKLTLGDANFKRLRAYRQCYLHRRAVMFKYNRAPVDSSVYRSSTVGTTDHQVTRTQVMLCDDPEAVDPKSSRATKKLLPECRRLSKFATTAIVDIQIALEDAWNGQEENDSEIDRA